MNRLSLKQKNHLMRKQRVRANVSGTETRPRLSVHVSNQHITAQLIDDTKHKTIAYVSSIGQKTLSNNLSEKAVWTGAEIANKAKTLKIKQVVFDRNGRLYHGRIKALADSARSKGLEF